MLLYSTLDLSMNPPQLRIATGELLTPTVSVWESALTIYAMVFPSMPQLEAAISSKFIKIRPAGMLSALLTVSVNAAAVWNKHKRMTHELSTFPEYPHMEIVATVPWHSWPGRCARCFGSESSHTATSARKQQQQQQQQQHNSAIYR